ncbi:MAG: HAD family hydrolase [Nanoarchaeota archaeon]
MIKIISFNLDGNLLDKVSFEELFYYEEMPKLVSVQHKLGLDKAKALVKREYSNVSAADPNFYRPLFWFERFKIKPNWQGIVDDMIHLMHIHRELPLVFVALRKKYMLVVVSKHAKDFLRAKLIACGLLKDIQQIVSAVDDFNVTKKDGRLYEFIVKTYQCKPSEVLHVGDSKDIDYDIPSGLGIHALILDREQKKKGVHQIQSLKEIESHISAINKEDEMEQTKKPKILYVQKEEHHLFDF